MAMIHEAKGGERGSASGEREVKAERLKGQAPAGSYSEAGTPLAARASRSLPHVEV